MYLLSQNLRAELLATPQMVKAVTPDNIESSAPALFIKASTLSLKYQIRATHVQLLLGMLPGSNLLMYGVFVHDGDDLPAFVWSLIQDNNEADALREAAMRKELDTFLFNEGAINVSSASMSISTSSPQMSFPASFRYADKSDYQEARVFLDSRSEPIGPSSFSDGQLWDLTIQGKWKELNSHYITNQLADSMLNIFDDDEGRQQEELALWLIDQLSPKGAYLSPQVREIKADRELTDLLLTYPGGAFLFESKTLSILDRGELPTRKKLQKNVIKNIDKALSQLRGGIKNVVAGLEVIDSNGEKIVVTSDMPFHCVILIPDLNLLYGLPSHGKVLIEKFKLESKAYLHLLDPASLLRSVQHALMFAKRSDSGMPSIMTFDAALMMRWEKAMLNETADFDFIVHFE